MSALRSLASAAASAVYDAINNAHSSDDLDHLSRRMWKEYGEGAISEDDAAFLSSCIDRRRPLGRTTAPGHARTVGTLAGRICGRFTPRQRPRSPDRKASRDRRRMLGGSSALPDNLRHHYTEGQRAVLCIVAGEIKRHGICDMPIDKIAALAGVCRTTVQTAMHEARRLLHIKIIERPRPGRKSLSNIVEVISPEWKAWLRRGPSAARGIGSKTMNLVSTTKNTDRKKEAFEEEKSRQWGQGTRYSPPDALARRAS
jgi:hypothetical protein